MRITIRSSIENGAKEPRTYQLRCSAEFAYAGGKTTFTAPGADGSWREPTPTETGPASWPYLSVLSRYDGPRKLNGAWRMENLPGGLAAEGRFAPDTVAALNLIRSSTEGIGDIVEIHTPEREVSPGGTIILEHTLEIIAP